jgi:putative transposase
LRGQDDGVVTTAPVLARVGPFADCLAAAFEEASAFAALRRSETAGRLLGSGDWIERLGQAFARPLAPRKRGPKPREAGPTSQHDLFGKLSP